MSQSLPEPRRRLAHQPREQADAERGVAGLEHRDLARGRVDQIVMVPAEPVVPITIGVREARAASRCASSAAGAEKSTRTSRLARDAGGIVARIGAAGDARAQCGRRARDRLSHPAEAAIDADAGHGRV
jgi:hypothetical protein